MSDVRNVQQNAYQRATVKAAAEDLAARLKAIADMLAAQAKPRRVAYGPGRVGPLLRRRSPAGYVLDPVSLKVLLPDGRVWSYSRNEASRFPAGRTFDARIDYHEFARGRSFLGGREFIFLGAVLDKYSFGLAVSDHTPGDTDSGGLSAIYGEGPTVRWVTADEAFSAVTESALANN